MFPGFWGFRVDFVVHFTLGLSFSARPSGFFPCICPSSVLEGFLRLSRWAAVLWFGVAGFGGSGSLGFVLRGPRDVVGRIKVELQVP